MELPGPVTAVEDEQHTPLTRRAYRSVDVLADLLG